MLEGRIEEARYKAVQVLPIAEAFQLPLVVTHARQIVEGKTMLENARSINAATVQEDEDHRVAREPDARLKQFARQQLENLQLPAERLPVLEREAFAMREEAQARLNWCRHIELIQDKTHTLEHTTLYAQDPYRMARCHAVNLSLAFECTDPKIAISSFQYRVCQGCPLRSPKQPLAS